MAHNAQFWDDALSQEIRGLQQLLQRADWMSDVGKVSVLFRAEKKLHAAQDTQEEFMMEARKVTDTEERQRYKDRLMKLTKELATCADSLNAALEALDKDDKQADPNEDAKAKERRQTMRKQSRASIVSMRNIVVKAQQAGHATTEQLRQQRTQLSIIEQQVQNSETPAGTAVGSRGTRRDNFAMSKEADAEPNCAVGKVVQSTMHMIKSKHKPKTKTKRPF